MEHEISPFKRNTIRAILRDLGPNRVQSIKPIVERLESKYIQLLYCEQLWDMSPQDTCVQMDIKEGTYYRYKNHLAGVTVAGDDLSELNLAVVALQMYGEEPDFIPGVLLKRVDTRGETSEDEQPEIAPERDELEEFIAGAVAAAAGISNEDGGDESNASGNRNGEEQESRPQSLLTRIVLILAAAASIAIMLGIMAFLFLLITGQLDDIFAAPTPDVPATLTQLAVEATEELANQTPVDSQATAAAIAALTIAALPTPVLENTPNVEATANAIAIATIAELTRLVPTPDIHQTSVAELEATATVGAAFTDTPTTTSTPAPTDTPTATPSPTMPSPGVTIFEDSFDLRLGEEWEELVGDWLIVNGQLTISGSETEGWKRIFVGDESWTNYSVEVDVYTGSHILCREVALYARRMPDNSLLSATFNDLGIKLRSENVAGASEITSVGQPGLDSDNPKHLRLDVEDDIISVYVNGVRRLQTQNADHTAGGAGLGFPFSRQCPILLFDNFRVTSK